MTERPQKLVSEPDRIAPLLAPLGWVFHGLAHVEAYGAAATLVEQGKVEEAEELLVETYKGGRLSLHPLLPPRYLATRETRSGARSG